MLDFSSIVAGTVLMLKKYTCINININSDSNEKNFKNGIIILPILGFMIGFIAFCIADLKLFYDRFFVSALILIYYTIITKSVNLKDTYISLNRILHETEQLNITYGTIGVFMMYVLYFSLFGIVPATTLIVMPVAGFSNLMLLSYVIKSDKHNTAVMKNCEKYHVIAAFCISFLLTVIFNYRLIISLTLTYMTTSMLLSMAYKKFDSLFVEIEGFLIEITQIIFLIITYIMFL